MPEVQAHTRPERRLVSEAVAASMLGVSTKTFAREVRAGALPYVRIGRRRLYDVRDIDRLIEIDTSERDSGVYGRRAKRHVDFFAGMQTNAGRTNSRSYRSLS